MRGPGTWVLSLRLESTRQWAAGWDSPKLRPLGCVPCVLLSPACAQKPSTSWHVIPMMRLWAGWLWDDQKWNYLDGADLIKLALKGPRPCLTGFEAVECEGLRWPQGKGGRASNNLEWLLARDQRENGRLVQELPAAEQPECIRKRAPGIRQDPRTSWRPSFNLVRPNSYQAPDLWKLFSDTFVLF